MEKDIVKPNKEIDLSKIFIAIWNIIVKALIGLAQLLIWLIDFAIKRWKIFAIMAISAVIFGGLNYFEKPVYESGFTIRTNGVPTFQAKPIVETLSKLVASPYPEVRSQLPEIMGIDSTEITNIVAIEPHYWIDILKNKTIDIVDMNNSHNPKDSINVISKEFLYIGLKSKDPVAFSKIRNGVLYFLNNDSVMVRGNRLRIKDMKENISSISKDLILLDSLSKISYLNPTNDIPVIQEFKNKFMVNANRQLFYNDKHTLIRRKKDYLDELDLYPEVVTIMSDVSPGIEPINRGKTIMIKRAAGLFFIEYLLVLAIFFLVEGIKKFRK